MTNLSVAESSSPDGIQVKRAAVAGVIAINIKRIAGRAGAATAGHCPHVDQIAIEGEDSACLLAVAKDQRPFIGHLTVNGRTVAAAEGRPEATFTACWLPISPIVPSPDSHSVPSCTLVSPL